MTTTKLTLSAEQELITKAKRLAQSEGTSLSSMFSRFLESILSHRQTQSRPGPLTLKATRLVRLPAGKSDRELLTGAISAKYGKRP